jgi:hypothetical protein
MKTWSALAGRFTALLITAVALASSQAAAHAADLKLEAVLVWGTNDSTPADPSHRPVSQEIAKRLGCLPFKYTNYYEVNRMNLAVPSGATTTVRLSKDCEVSVTQLEKGQVEVTLIGKGQPVGKITQKLHKGKTLVTGGNAPNFTAWFVILRQVE